MSGDDLNPSAVGGPARASALGIGTTIPSGRRSGRTRYVSGVQHPRSIALPALLASATNNDSKTYSRNNERTLQDTDTSFRKTHRKRERQKGHTQIDGGNSNVQ